MWKPMRWDPYRSRWIAATLDECNCCEVERLLLFLVDRMAAERTPEARACQSIRLEMMRRVYLAKSVAAADLADLRKELRSLR